ncbi:hypothetical protein [Pseudomonas vanderleydeniana]|uniref:Uncharacterized protein n=1 Tax=Pseudomonas vanderleydeniana TaxID=2745495 RepID=A0A9E6TQ42_9PSED|nr:hypothetical protein [Pseudomonas vanderleydeniana]QXI25605.1 hypothetical protein HU752_016595 [Pseudomonas vanderleydeniana]
MEASNTGYAGACSCLATLALMTLLQGCASQVPFNALPQSEAVVEHTDFRADLVGTLRPPLTPYYAVDGHYSTAGYVAQLAGYSSEKVHEFSCYSQTPDQEAVHYSAPYVAVWGIFNWPFRHEIVNGLHSLHGGDARAVALRRGKLKRLIETSLSQGRPEWETGFLIHALGDSYAHVHGTADGERAYGEFAGHALANLPWGERPDSIFVDHHYVNYLEYVNVLFEVFTNANKTPGDTESLRRFREEITAEAAKGNDARKKVSFFMNGTVFSDMGGGSLRQCATLNEKLDSKEVRAFLDRLSRDLEG